MNELRKNVDKIHTTELGKIRIQKNLKLEKEDILEECKRIILDKNGKIEKKGKNWYCTLYDIVITINSHSYTIITAHQLKERKI